MDPVFSPAFYSPYERAVETAFLMLCAARSRFHGHVRTMTFRLKSPESIRGKLQKQGLPISAESAVTALNDIAGLRVVLPNLDSVYRFASLLCQSSAAEFVRARDYIAHPKPSGYRALHLLMHIPIDGDMIPVEIQLRTPVMDMWARVEHDLCYKPISSSAG